MASVLSTRAAAARAAEVRATAQASLDTFLGAPRVHIDAHQPDDDESSARAFKASSEPEAAAAAAPVPLRQPVDAVSEPTPTTTATAADFARACEAAPRKGFGAETSCTLSLF